MNGDVETAHNNLTRVAHGIQPHLLSLAHTHTAERDRESDRERGRERERERDRENRGGGLGRDGDSKVQIRSPQDHITRLVPTQNEEFLCNV